MCWWKCTIARGRPSSWKKYQVALPSLIKGSRHLYGEESYFIAFCFANTRMYPLNSNFLFSLFSFRVFLFFTHLGLDSRRDLDKFYRNFTIISLFFSPSTLIHKNHKDILCKKKVGMNFFYFWNFSFRPH